MNSKLDIVGICGSLRAGSINRWALKLAGELMPASMALETIEWREVPIFDADVLAKGNPPVVQALRERIRRADGIVIGTPEYNFSIPGGLKNLLDWLSRGDDQPLAHKPVTILTASPGPLGGARVQYDLRRVMLFVNSMVMIKPEVFIGLAGTKFDAVGNCTDEGTKKFIGAQMAAFEKWIRGVKAMAEAD
ncbi:MAG: NADPH-dependent FMN reductase [Nitrospira sp.]